MSVIIAKTKSFGYKNERGSFEVTGQVLSPSTTYTVQIPLAHDKFTMGQLVFYLPATVASSSNRRMTSFIMFTTDANNAIARSGGRSNYNVYGYNFTDYWVMGYHRANDSVLTGNYYGASGLIRVTNCQISGSNIELVFENPHGSASATLTIKGEYEVKI